MYCWPAALASLTICVGVVLYRVELRRQLFIFGYGDFGAQHDPLAYAGDVLAFPDAGRNGVDAPVDEHAELGCAPPIQARVLIGAGPLPAFRFEVFHLCHFSVPSVSLW